MRRKGIEKKSKGKTKKRENDRSKEADRRVGNLGQGGRSSKIRGRSKKDSTRMFSQVNPHLWQENQ